MNEFAITFRRKCKLRVMLTPIQVIDDEMHVIKMNGYLFRVVLQS